ncbi:MAG: hypothetical protein WDW36_006291 [Sanguina aurantia]
MAETLLLRAEKEDAGASGSQREARRKRISNLWSLALQRKLSELSAHVEAAVIEARQLLEFKANVPPLVVAELRAEDRNHLESRHKGRMADISSKHCQGMLKLIAAHKYAHPFHTAVDTQTYKNYTDIVTEPCDLTLIRDRCEAVGHYKDPMAFANDLDLVFRNAKRYNRPGSDCFVMADVLHEFCQVQYRSLIAPRLVEEEQASLHEEVVAKHKRAEAINAQRSHQLETRVMTLMAFIDELQRSIVEAKSQAASACEPMLAPERSLLASQMQALKPAQVEACMLLVAQSQPHKLLASEALPPPGRTTVGAHHSDVRCMTLDLAALDALVLRQLQHLVSLCRTADRAAAAQPAAHSRPAVSGGARGVSDAGPLAVAAGTQPGGTAAGGGQSQPQPQSRRRQQLQQQQAAQDTPPSRASLRAWVTLWRPAAHGKLGALQRRQLRQPLRMPLRQAWTLCPTLLHLVVLRRRLPALGPSWSQWSPAGGDVVMAEQAISASLANGAALPLPNRREFLISDVRNGSAESISALAGVLWPGLPLGAGSALPSIPAITAQHGLQPVASGDRIRSEPPADPITTGQQCRLLGFCRPRFTRSHPLMVATGLIRGDSSLGQQPSSGQHAHVALAASGPGPMGPPAPGGLARTGSIKRKAPAPIQAPPTEPSGRAPPSGEPPPSAPLHHTAATTASADNAAATAPQQNGARPAHTRHTPDPTLASPMPSFGTWSSAQVTQGTQGGGGGYPAHDTPQRIPLPGMPFTSTPLPPSLLQQQLNQQLNQQQAHGPQAGQQRPHTLNSAGGTQQLLGGMTFRQPSGRPPTGATPTAPSLPPASHRRSRSPSTSDAPGLLNKTAGPYPSTSPVGTPNAAPPQLAAPTSALLRAPSRGASPVTAGPPYHPLGPPPSQHPSSMPTHPLSGHPHASQQQQQQQHGYHSSSTQQYPQHAQQQGSLGGGPALTSSGSLPLGGGMQQQVGGGPVNSMNNNAMLSSAAVSHILSQLPGHTLAVIHQYMKSGALGGGGGQGAGQHASMPPGGGMMYPGQQQQLQQQQQHQGASGGPSDPGSGNNPAGMNSGGGPGGQNALSLLLATMGRNMPHLQGSVPQNLSSMLMPQQQQPHHHQHQQQQFQQQQQQLQLQPHVLQQLQQQANQVMMLQHQQQQQQQQQQMSMNQQHGGMHNPQHQQQQQQQPHQVQQQQQMTPQTLMLAHQQVQQQQLAQLQAHGESAAFTAPAAPAGGGASFAPGQQPSHPPATPSTAAPSPATSLPTPPLQSAAPYSDDPTSAPIPGAASTVPSTGMVSAVLGQGQDQAPNKQPASLSATLHALSQPPGSSAAAAHPSPMGSQPGAPHGNHLPHSHRLSSGSVPSLQDAAIPRHSAASGSAFRGVGLPGGAAVSLARSHPGMTSAAASVGANPEASLTPAASGMERQRSAGPGGIILDLSSNADERGGMGEALVQQQGNNSNSTLTQRRTRSGRDSPSPYEAGGRGAEEHATATTTLLTAGVTKRMGGGPKP